MKTRSLAFTILSTVVAIGTAAAQSVDSSSKSRAEVRAETAAAIRTGDVASGFEGLKMNELLPRMYHDAPSRRDTVATSRKTADTGPVDVVQIAPVPMIITK